MVPRIGPGAVPYQIRQSPRIVRTLLPWKVFLATEAALIYLNGVQPLPKMLGFSDMFHAINLAWVRVFVTDDRSLLRLTEEVAAIAVPEPRRFLTYRFLRMELLGGEVA